MPFQRRRKVTVQVVGPALQWTMYGADPPRSQVQTEIRVRPSFRVVWSAGRGSLVELPAVVSEGVASRSRRASGGSAGARRSSTPRPPDRLRRHADERTYALDARTGKRLWSYPDGQYTPVVADIDRLYLVGHARLYGMVEQ
jgi:hypothetical protein